MKKLVVGGVVLGAALAALRRFGPALGERAMDECARLFDRMPEEFPPKRMLRGIEEIRDQNRTILHHLEEAPQQPALAAAH